MRIEKGFVLGLVIGIAIFVCLTGFPEGYAHADSAPTTDNFSVLYNFGSVAGDGANPLGSLTLSGTTFYGMTTGVGDNSDSSGTIFRIKADGTGYQVLYNFGSVNNGANPHGDLVISGSTLYGMTLGAGTLLSGTVFKINNDGTGYQVLHDFGTVPNDGYCPFGSLTLLGSTLYGMTPSGGAGAFGLGTIFQVNTDGSGYRVLHSFGIAANDGVYPYGSLTFSGTTLYGMTSGGGGYGAGTIFQINSDGTGYQVLYSFGGVANDGAYPYGSLTLSGTTLYGMTQVGGAYGLGTIFQINTGGTGYQELYSFAGYPNDGAYPTSSLTLSGSTLYGMTAHGGRGDGYGSGTIFQINTSGTGYQVLYDFGSASSNDGGSLTLSGTMLYGLAYGGGSYDKGTIFSVSETPVVPDAPTGVTAAAGIGQAAVSFTAPAGPPLSYYTVTSNPGGITATGAGGPIIVEGLTNGTAYTFTVTATNTIGTGPPSGPSNSVTPYSVPPSYIAALAGTWNANFIVSGSNAPEWERGTVTVNPDETLSDVSITDNNGNPDQVINNGASAFWSSPGGLFLTTGQPNNILCQIDSGNTVIVCTETGLSNGSPGLLIFTKQAASCSLADLTGAWEGNFLTSSGQYSGAAETDSLTIDSNGTWTDSTTGGTGTWPISSIGVITAPSDSTFSGVMDADKTVMVATSGANTGSGGSTSPAVLSVYAKQAASYLPEDLAGTWQGNSLSMWTWERDTLTINQDGTFTMSSTANDGSTNNNISGTCTLSPYGAITLVVNEGSSQTIISGDMAADKTVMVTTAQSSINDYIEIFTKSAAGAMTVTISPDAAVSAGAMWSVDGEAWQVGGATVSNLRVGPHTVAFNNITGWTTPASQTFNVSNGQTTSLGGVYVQQTGSLTVTISPAGAVSAGAMWNVDGGSWQTGGTTVPGITVGSHTVAFNNITGWTTPAGQTFNVSNGQTASLGGVYVQQTGSLTVTISPAGAVSAGAMWNVDGGSWQAGGTTVPGITVGSHTVAFNNIAGWSIPPQHAANITNGQTVSAMGTYAPVFTATFSASTTGGKAPLTVHFTDSSVGKITEWHWSFGDGQTSTIRSPSHSYSKAGAYTVTLTVTGAGRTNTCTQPDLITVYASPTANFSASPNAGKAPLQVNFTNESTGFATSWLWRFGDGATSTAEDPNHTYSKPGTYTAMLTAYGPGEPVPRL